MSIYNNAFDLTLSGASLSDKMYLKAVAALIADDSLSVEDAAYRFMVDPAVLANKLTAKQLKGRPL